MEFLGAIGILGMIGSIGTASYNSGTQSDKLRQSIQDMSDKIDRYKDGYTKLLKADAILGQTLIQGMSEDVDAITQASQQIDVAKTEHAKSYKTIQMAGVSFIIFLAFVFVLKIFGFYDIVQEVLVYPFKKAFQK